MRVKIDEIGERERIWESNNLIKELDMYHNRKGSIWKEVK